MKKTLIIIGIVLGIILLFVGGWFMYANGVYNKAIAAQETVDEQWGNVQASYQRRADLVPNLVATVKGAAENEKEILTKVTNARAGIRSSKTPGEIEMFGREINSAINMAFEAYPQIKSTENFKELQAQLEGTENRINVERRNYNGSVKEYNTLIRGFFRSKALGFIGSEDDNFVKKEAFEASEGSDKAPQVKF